MSANEKRQKPRPERALDQPWRKSNSQLVVGFFSYKGGVGRTLLLCNTALTLLQRLRDALKGEPGIFCVDLDLPAPGILPILGLRQKASGIFHALLRGNLDEPLETNSVQLRFEERAVPLFAFAEEITDSFGIQQLINLFSDKESRVLVRQLINYFKRQARVICSAPFTLVDIGAGLGELPRELFRSLDHLVLVVRADRQHRKALPRLLRTLGAYHAQYGFLENVHVLLNQLPPTWLDEDSEERQDFLLDSGLSGFIDETSDNAVKQVRTLNFAPSMESALTQETLFFPEGWSYTKLPQPGIVRVPDTEAEKKFREATARVTEHILEGGGQ